MLDLTHVTKGVLVDPALQGVAARDTVFAAHARAFSFPASREPIFTSQPRDANPRPRAWPTSPEPRIPTLMLFMPGV